MHRLSIPPDIIARVVARCGRPHPFDLLDPNRTALVVIDMQNYFVQPGYLGEVPLARAIVPGVNILAEALRVRGGCVVWVKTSTIGARESWSIHEALMTSDKRDLRYATLDEAHDGSALWPALDLRADDAIIVKTRYSAFIQGSSNLESYLRERGIDTVLIAGTQTNVCCESSARDAMMLNFRTLMVADALATYTDHEHSASLAAFYGMFGDVQTVDEVIASLDRSRAASALGACQQA